MVVVNAAVMVLQIGILLVDRSDALRRGILD